MSLGLTLLIHKMGITIIPSLWDGGEDNAVMHMQGLEWDLVRVHQEGLHLLSSTATYVRSEHVIYATCESPAVLPPPSHFLIYLNFLSSTLHLTPPPQHLCAKSLPSKLPRSCHTVFPLMSLNTNP